MRMKIGDLPLHSAVFWGCRAEVLDSLLQHYPAAVPEENSEGDSPILLAFDDSLWTRNYSEIGNSNVEGSGRQEIMSFHNENGENIPIAPINLLSPYKVLRRMIKAYYELLRVKEERTHDDAISNIKVILNRDENYLMRKVKACRKHLRGRQTGAMEIMLNKAELYLRRILNDGEISDDSD